MKSNKEILQAHINDNPNGVIQDKIGNDFSGRNLEKITTQYPKEMNKFIETLVNKVTFSKLFSRQYENHLKLFKGERLEYGETLEQLFVQMAQMKNFESHWDNGGSDEADLIRALKPKVEASYISINFGKDVKTTIYRSQMIKAFYSENGLSKMIQGIIASLKTKLEYEEERRTENLIARLIDGINYNGKKIKETNTNAKVFPSYSIGDQADRTALENLSVSLRDLAFKFTRMSNNYNMAGVQTFTPKENIVIYINSHFKNLLDVSYLANVMQLSKAELLEKIVMVPEIATKNQGGTYDATDTDIVNDITLSATETDIKANSKVVCVIMDKDLIQLHDSWNHTGSFYNDAKGYTNYFESHEGVAGSCLFANGVALYVGV